MALTSKTEIAQRLASRLKDARKSQNLSLEALSEISGVSRSMLSSIERGESSPTVASLWNLTQALKIDFSGLLGEGGVPSEPILEVVRAGQAPVIDSRGDGCRIKILSPPEDVGEAEVYDIELAVGGALDGAPHAPGAVEHLTVLSGAVDVEVGPKSAALSVGETARYRADVAHAIRAGDDGARVLLIVKGG